MPEFTRTEGIMMRLLSDGLPHGKEELHSCLPDELATVQNMRSHIHRIRRKIQPIGQDILCLSGGNRRPIRYQLVRLLSVKAE